MSILTMMEAYDHNRDSYIAELEAEIAMLRKDISELTDLLMRGEQLREALMLKAICAGAFNLAKLKANETCTNQVQPK